MSGGAPETAPVVDLAHDGRGVARLGGKAVFVAGALPGETVSLVRLRRRARHDEARLVAVLEPSPDRVTPRCAHFGRCGGCSLQHLKPPAQLRAKERELHEQLARLGQVAALRRLPPLEGPLWAYRRRARLGVKYHARSGRVIVGFRERESPWLAALTRCEVLAAPVGAMTAGLSALIATLEVRAALPQIEVAIGEPAAAGGAEDRPVAALVLRVLEPPTDADRGRLREFASRHGVEFWLQPGGPATARPLDAFATPLRYALPEFDLTLEFEPLDFVQVNGELNRRMVSHALALLAPQPADAVLDLYCGIGNFTLPLARRAGSVQGVEGDAGLVARARANAARNGLDNARFALADLTGDPAGEPWARQRYQRVLLDPPRAGAAAALPAIAASGAGRIVYISCHPGSLARDAGLLVREHGFRLEAAGVMDMFPHTAHVEAIAVFERAA